MKADLIREFASYPGLGWKLARWKAIITPEKVAFGPHKDQYFLHFAPTCRQHTPVVLYIHGGGWNSGNPKQFSFIGQAFAQAGYHCILVGYRKAPKFRFPAQTEDLCAGYRKSLHYLAARNIESQKIAVVGSSAGAHLGALLCLDKELQAEWELDPDRFCCFAGLGGPYSFESPTYSVEKLTAQLFPEGYDRRRAEPVRKLNVEGRLPLFVIHSRKDSVVGYRCGVDFYEQARTLGYPARFYSAQPKGDHSDYTAGIFLMSRERSGTLNWLFDRLEEL